MMLDDGVRRTAATMRVADVATLLAEALPRRRRTIAEARSPHDASAPALTQACPDRPRLISWNDCSTNWTRPPMRTAAPEPSRSTEPRSCSSTWSRRTTAPTVGELAAAARACRRARPRGSSARSSARGSSSAIRPAARSAPGRCSSRYARRETTAARPRRARRRDALERLARASGETANLGVATPTAVEMLDQRDSRHTRRLDQLGGPSGASPRLGRSARSSWPRVRCRCPPGHSSRSGPLTITDVAELRRDLELTRGRGYAVAVDELEAGLWSVAAPVHDAGGSVIAALSISGPTVRLRSGLLDELGRLVRNEASTLSVRIGYDDVKRGVA